ncbi:MAG: winged helix-turn-helix domain-containing protein [Bryobacteraceae bacterium]|nr:winged helix-turn-helix domain-containing protein [Bryobacteraceae bacterium]
MADSNPTGRLRFGPFDFDPANGELRREGMPKHLQPQPAQVLALLLSQRGEVVTRESLRKAIWGDDTVVDYDRSLNFCVAQIRSALGDSSDSPLYIKTVPKRGYQFIAPVSISTPPESIVTTRPRRVPLLLASAAGVVSLLLGFTLWSRNPDPAQPTGIRIAVARFENRTGDPQFDRFSTGLTDTLVAELTEWGGNRFAVIGNAAILRLPRNQQDLLTIHSTLKADLVVLGDVQRTVLGGEVQRTVNAFQATAHLIALPGQTHLKVARVRSAQSDSARAQSELAEQIIKGLSQSLKTRARPRPNK